MWPEANAKGDLQGSHSRGGAAGLYGGPNERCMGAEGTDGLHSSGLIMKAEGSLLPPPPPLPPERGTHTNPIPLLSRVPTASSDPTEGVRGVGGGGH